MRLIEPTYEFIVQDVRTPENLKISALKHIERIGRICYKSEDRITEDSAEKFVNNLVNSKHRAVLEHATVYFQIPITEGDIHEIFFNYLIDRYHFRTNQTKPLVLTKDKEFYYISTNYGYIFDLCELDKTGRFAELVENYVVPFNPKFHEERPSVKFTTSLQVLTDLVRHRKMSYAGESTRYCNYSKGKYNEELTFMLVPWVNLKPGSYTSRDVRDYTGGDLLFLRSCLQDEENYLEATKYLNWQAQQASTFLPKALKSEMVITGFISDWAHVFGLRSLGLTGQPRQEILNLYRPLQEEFIEKFYEPWIENMGAFKHQSHNTYYSIVKFLYNNDKKNNISRFAHVYGELFGEKSDILSEYK